MSLVIARTRYQLLAVNNVYKRAIRPEGRAPGHLTLAGGDRSELLASESQDRTRGVVVACAVALATPVAVGQRTAAHDMAPTGKIANGFRVFNDYFCADCHLMKAAGTTPYRGYDVSAGRRCRLNRWMYLRSAVVASRCPITWASTVELRRRPDSPLLLSYASSVKPCGCAAGSTAWQAFLASWETDGHIG